MHFITLLAIAPQVWASSLLSKRQVQTDAVCDQAFAWTSNSKQQPPCLVAAYVAAACGTNSYQVTKLPQGNRYDRPNVTTANACTCSWAWYNLLSACTTCQDMPASVPGWDDWITDCSSLVSTSDYFPPTITLSSATSIPFYAGTDPRKWSNHHFDATTAKSIANEGHADLVPGPGSSSPQPKTSKTPVGAIAGGVIGGVVILLAATAVGIFCFLRQRRRKPTGHKVLPPTIMEHQATPLMHTRVRSEDSHKSTTSAGYITSVPASPSEMATHVSPPNLSQHAHSNSMTSLPYFMQGQAPSPFTTPSPPPHPASPESMNREQIITPFLLGASPASRPSEKSSLPGANVPIYDPPTSPPNRMNTPFGDPALPPRRFNPPAYSEYEGTPPASTTQLPSNEDPNARRERGHRREKGSTDTQHTWDPSTTRFGSGRTDNGRSASDGSMSAMDSVIGRMGLDPEGTLSGTGGQTVATGNSNQLQGQPRVIHSSFVNPKATKR